MNRNKKILSVVLAAATMGVAVGVARTNVTSRLSSSQDCSHSHVEHYKVYPTTTDGGRIEHWACCECGKAWYDEGLTKPVSAERSELNIAASTAATEIQSSALDAGDLIANIYGQSDKTKGLDQTNWGEGGTTCKSTGNWKFYNVDGVNALKASAVTLNDTQRTLQHECNNGGFGEFRFAITASQIQYVTFDYKYYDLNTETTLIGDDNVHFVAQQYDGTAYYNSNATTLVNDNAWHKAVVSFPTAQDITYLPMKFFHFDGEFYISNLKVHSEEPSVLMDYDFSHSTHMLDFSASNNVSVTRQTSGSDHYLKVSKTSDGSAYVALNRNLTAGEVVSFVVSYVTADPTMGSGQFTVLTSGGNGLSPKDYQFAMGCAPWDGGWDGHKIKIDAEILSTCSSAVVQLVFNSDPTAYYMIHEVIVKGFGSYVNFAHATDVDGFIVPQRINYQVTDAGLKITNNGESGTHSISYLKHIAEGEKAYIRLSYHSADNTFVNGSNQFTVIACKPNNAFDGGNGDDTVMGSAPWDGGWNGNEIVLEFTASAECRGLFIQFVFNNEADAYFTLSGIAFGTRTSVNMSNAGDALLFSKPESITTIYSAKEKALNITKNGDSTHSIVFYRKLAAGATVNLTLKYTSSDNNFESGGQFTALLYKADKNSLQISGACAVMGSAPWDGGWDGSSYTLSLAIDDACNGVWLQMVFNNDANGYFSITNVTIA